MRFVDERTIKTDKLPTALDKFVLRLCKLLGKHTKYVIVSGYVSILFGRARSTEDIDVLIERLPRERFYVLYSDLVKKGYWCLNAKTRAEAFQTVEEGVGIRFAKRKDLIPNMEMKFTKNELEKAALADNIKVVLSTGSLNVSRIEQQIAYKELVLGSQKDLEDARHLETVFKDRIDKELLERYRKRFAR